MHVKDPICICRERVDLNAGSMETFVNLSLYRHVRGFYEFCQGSGGTSPTADGPTASSSDGLDRQTDLEAK